jgi:cytochrome c-type biogenesis protein CcmH
MNLRFRTRVPSIFLIVLILSLMVVPFAYALTAGEITQGLTCTCGCNMLVSACEGSMECDVAKKITNKVEKMIAQGQSKEQIIQYFVDTEGERILAAPTRKGFNLVAWILPFVAVLLGGGLVYIFLDKCISSRKDNTHIPGSSDIKQLSKGKYLDRLEKELKDFEI